MKDIKQYIGKKVAIECASSEEWDQISKLTDNTFDNYFNKSSNAKCFNLLYLGHYWSSDNRKQIETDGYIIYPASDFIEFQFEVGKWYTSSGWQPGSYAKFKNKDKDYFYFSEKIYNKEHFIRCDSWGIYNTFREVPIEEIQHLLPKETEINTYGLKIGDHLPVQKIREWSNIGKNRFDDRFRDKKIWEQSEALFIGDREILSFKLLDGQVGFQVSGTISIYLRAEGFKEFLEDSFVLPEKWCINRKDKPEVIKWFNKNAVKGQDYSKYLLGYYTHYPSWRNNCHTYENILEGYTEITLEQFKKYVLKKSPLPSSQSDFKIIKDIEEPILFFNESDKELIIPKINKVLSAIDYSVQTKLPELNISLPKNKAKEVKQIKIENFSITI